MAKKLVSAIAVAALALAGPAMAFAAGKNVSQSGHGKFVIALSNAYNGNSWRHQMVKDFITAAKQAKAEGLISGYIVDNSTSGLTGQLTQMDDLILQHVSAIVVDSASSSALNGVIAQAHRVGIPVISFDTGVTSPYSYNLNTSFFQWAHDSMQWVANRLHGRGNVVLVRTQTGTQSDAQLYNGYMSVIKKHPGLKVVSTFYGNADVTTTQSQLSTLLPSLPKVDAVMCAAGGYGAVEAFEAGHRPVPIVTTGLSSQFIHWWIAAHKKNGYTTIGQVAAPSMSSDSLWVSLAILQGKHVPRNMTVPTDKVTQADLMKFKNLPPNTFADLVHSQQWVQTNLLSQK